MLMFVWSCLCVRACLCVHVCLRRGRWSLFEFVPDYCQCPNYYQGWPWTAFVRSWTCVHVHCSQFLFRFEHSVNTPGTGLWMPPKMRRRRPNAAAAALRCSTTCSPKGVHTMFRSEQEMWTGNVNTCSWTREHCSKHRELKRNRINILKPGRWYDIDLSAGRQLP